MKSISSVIRKLAANAAGLSDKDINLLNNVAPKLVLRVKDNVESKSDKPFEGLSDDDKKLLFAFVVYKRQNITTGPTDKPNNEDAALIMNDGLYKDLPNKQKLDMIEKDLAEQLNKAGLQVPMPKKAKNVNKDKGD